MDFDFTEIFDSYTPYSTGKTSPPPPPPPPPTTSTTSFNAESYAFIDSVLKDDKSEFISHAKRLFIGEDLESERNEALKLLSACCGYDSINCASSIINGDVGAVVPYINDVCSDTELSPLHTAAEAHAPRCIEMLIKRRARTDMRTKDERALLPLELALNNGSIDVTWNPRSDSIEDLILMLGDKDLMVVKLLVEKTKEVDIVAYTYAKAGEIVPLAVLLILAIEKIREAKVVVQDHDDSVPKRKRKTIYEAVIQEALCSHNSSMQYSEKRIVLLREIELLQLFGAAVFSESLDKQTSSFISVVQAGDEAVLELLINTNIDVNETDPEGNTVLQCSLKGSSVPQKQQTRIMQLLIAHGARVSQKNKLGLSAVHFAAANGNVSALEILLTAYPDLVNVKTIIKETPLFFAVKNNHLDCVELLLRCGASTEIHNLRKQRPRELTQSQDIRFLLNPTSISCFSKEAEVAQSHSASPTKADDEETVRILGKSVPPWLKKFVIWLPRYLQDTSKSYKKTGYPLSSLKADFRAICRMDIEHASLGFPKLIDFIKSFPKLCQMKVVPIGKHGAATHWVMFPTKSKCSHLKGRPPEPFIINKVDSVASPIKPKTSSTPPDLKLLQEVHDSITLPDVEFIHQAHDSKTFKAAPEAEPQPLPLATSSYIDRRKLKHPVLETLARIRNSTSVFFLREFDFYQSYETCLREGMCFWCNKNMLLWANFPCRHKLWCTSCKQEVSQSAAAAGLKSFEEDHHRCVICDAKVERFILSSPFGFDHHRLSSDLLNDAELATSVLQFLNIGK
ncbi:E3 ubiquitin-protein ligase XBAT32 [Cardamine amara subsp. amara]|uniref:E3 ubiquitin-protein ligase XBAT32 n=1 Tax=Cardamine amara subsp. amara TaxID=228776 RepID=A0ABD1AJ14_CARAN